MSDAEGNKSHVIQSLIANAVIAAAKGVAAVVTGSGSMLAETIHSFADCGNQLILLLGIREAKRPPDDSHPLGYGRSLYFWSFMVALLLFSGGGVFSIYEGFHKLSHPEPLSHLSVAVGILVFSLALEGWATWQNLKDMNRRRGTMPFLQYLQDTKDSDLVVVFGENAAAVLGLIVAIMSTLIAQFFDAPAADAYGSIVIGVVLIGVAVFLAREVKSLLVGEAADPLIGAAARKIAAEDKRIVEIIRFITIQQGPGEVLVCTKFKCADGLTIEQVSEMINVFERRLREACPEVRWLFVEPDMQEWQNKPESPGRRVDAATS